MGVNRRSRVGEIPETNPERLGGFWQVERCGRDIKFISRVRHSADGLADPAPGDAAVRGRFDRQVAARGHEPAAIGKAQFAPGLWEDVAIEFERLFGHAPDDEVVNGWKREMECPRAGERSEAGKRGHCSLQVVTAGSPVDDPGDCGFFRTLRPGSGFFAEGRDQKRFGPLGSLERIGGGLIGNRRGGSRDGLVGGEAVGMDQRDRIAERRGNVRASNAVDVHVEGGVRADGFGGGCAVNFPEDGGIAVVDVARDVGDGHLIAVRIGHVDGGGTEVRSGAAERPVARVDRCGEKSRRRIRDEIGGRICHEFIFVLGDVEHIGGRTAGGIAGLIAGGNVGGFRVKRPSPVANERVPRGRRGAAGDFFDHVLRNGTGSVEAEGEIAIGVSIPRRS